MPVVLFNKTQDDVTVQVTVGDHCYHVGVNTLGGYCDQIMCYGQDEAVHVAEAFLLLLDGSTPDSNTEVEAILCDAQRVVDLKWYPRHSGE